MHDVTIRNRADGLVELGPRAAPVAPDDRLVVVASLIIGACGMFVAGALRAEAVAAILLSALGGELAVAVKGAVLVLLRRPAKIHDVARYRARRR